MKEKTPTSITRKLIELQQMSLPALQAKFEELYGFKTNAFNAAGLRKRLAFRVQELYYGGLLESEEKELDRFVESDRKANLKPEPNQKAVLLPGSRLLRTWHGKTYEVTVRKDGKFTYEGRIFRTLSGIATEITGSHWNGKVFFGVK